MYENINSDERRNVDAAPLIASHDGAGTEVRALEIVATAEGTSADSPDQLPPVEQVEQVDAAEPSLLLSPESDEGTAGGLEDELASAAPDDRLLHELESRSAEMETQLVQADQEIRLLRAEADILRATIARNSETVGNSGAGPKRRPLSWLSRPIFVSRRPKAESHSWEIETLRSARLFSPVWYLKNNPDLAEEAEDPLVHYVSKGAREGRDPHPLFDARWYREQYPDSTDANMSPLAHYLTLGASQGYQPCALFDTDYYLRQNADVASSGTNPLVHYVRHGAYEGRDPNPLFHSSWYLRQNPGLLQTRENPLAHYIEQGSRTGRDPHPLFDTAAYLQRNPDISGNPLEHFLRYGGLEGRDPHPLFGAAWYLETYPDVAAVRANPLTHYLMHGWKEGRRPHPDFDGIWYLENNLDVAATGQNPLLHFVVHGRDEGRAQRRGDVRQAPIQQAEPTVMAAADSSGTAAALPPMLGCLLTMFHDGRGNAALERCYRILADYGDMDIMSRDASLQPGIADLVEDTRQLARGMGGDDPAISVIIPVHNKFIYTLCCVFSLLSVARRRNFEVIVADDVSTDATQSVFQDMGGNVRIVRQSHQHGFLRNCNAAAAQARGRYLVFLNNDTFILPDWLDELVGTMERDRTIGFAGSKLVNADGTLQEAGGIVWKDASAWNFGRNGDPSAPQFNYVKDVDYVSGATIALPRAVWNTLGGFDDLYAPAYCEDVDLAFRVREAGWRTVYQPFSALIHHEGVSHGRDVSTGIKAYQERNRHLLRERWQPVLDAGHFENGTSVALARDRSGGRPRILIVDHYIPQPDRDAGSRSMMHYIALFARSGFAVTFWPHNRNFDKSYAMQLQRLGVETIYGWNDTWPDFNDWIRDNGGRLDYAFLSRPHVAADFIDAIRAHSRAKVLFYGHDIHFLRLQQQRAITGDETIDEEIRKWETLEPRIWPLCDAVYYPSVDEQRFVEAQAPGVRVRTLPLNIFDEERLAAAEARVRQGVAPAGHQLFFVAGFRHQPNVDAIQWFMAGAWPLIKAAIPDVRLVIAGSSPPGEVRAFAGDDVMVTGEISDEDLLAFYEASSAAIVPLRFGGGMKGKVLEALSLGVPLITTPVGLQGLNDAEDFAWSDGEIEAFARHVIFVLKNRNTPRVKVRILAGLRLLRARFSVEAARKVLSEDMVGLSE